MEQIKILVVDDEARMRKLVKDFLMIKGFQVAEAADGEEALDIFFRQKDIGLVLLDVMMPKMDGWEVLKIIRRHSKVPIIMLTARSEERDELQGFERRFFQTLFAGNTAKKIYRLYEYKSS